MATTPNNSNPNSNAPQPRTPNLQVHIDANRHYPIHIGAGLLHKMGTIDSVGEGFIPLPKGSTAVVVTNTTLAPLYAQTLQTALQNAKLYKNVLCVVLPDGEAHKNWTTLNLIFDALLDNACDRKTVLYALGGGVVGDMTGFAAATYMRGVAFVQVPTTLLSQVDSSVGGKTGINHPKGKNMVGAFYQPQLVVCDLQLLETLPKRELSAGWAEVTKYGPIFDMAFFAKLEMQFQGKNALNCRIGLDHAVQRSCEIKAHIVAQDEKEAGLRAILNFGHTFGHAIEAGLGYGTWLHGEAVACGMVMAMTLSHNMGLVDAKVLQRLVSLLKNMQLPIKAPFLDGCTTHTENTKRHLDLMRVDKKADAGEIVFVLVSTDENGQLRPIFQRAPDELVCAAIVACSHAH